MVTKCEKNVHLGLSSFDPRVFIASSAKTLELCPIFFFYASRRQNYIFHASQTFSILNNFFFLHFDQTAIELFQGGLIAICVNALDVHIIYTACTTRFSNLFLRASQFYSHNAIVYSIALYIHTVETLKI